VSQLPSLKKEYLRYDDFAKVDFRQLLGIKELQEETLEASTFANSYAENLGDGRFRLVSLPLKCQIAPINDFLIGDLDAESGAEILVVGNDYTMEAIYGKADAFTGAVLRFKDGNFSVLPSRDSGFYVPRQSNQLLKVVDREGNRLILAGQNNDSILVFSK